MNLIAGTKTEKDWKSGHALLARQCVIFLIGGDRSATPDHHKDHSGASNLQTRSLQDLVPFSTLLL